MTGTRSLISVLTPILPAVLSLLGLVLVVVAAFTVGVTIGFAAAGVACLVLAFYAESEGRP